MLACSPSISIDVIPTFENFELRNGKSILISGIDNF